MEYLRKIRNGDLEYEELMAKVEEEMAVLEKLYETSTLPHGCDHKKIDKLYKELMDM